MSISQKVASSVKYLVILNIFQRSLGIISTLILARVLTPLDFGVIAILALSMHLIDILSDLGIQQYIVQKNQINDDDLNTAWSIDVSTKLCLMLALCLAAPFIANYLNNPLLTTVLMVISLALPIKALKNPALSLYARDLNYQLIFKLASTEKILSFISVMIFLLIDKSYWAIVVGDIVSALVLFIGSYTIHSYRPKFSFKQLRAQFDFSKWSLLRGFTGFFRSQVDVLIASKLFPPTQLGGYHLTRELALTPALSLIIPATEPLLAAIAKAKQQQSTLSYRVRFGLFTLFWGLIPITTFIYFYNESVVAVVLGKNWLGYSKLLAFFSIMFITYCVHSLLNDCFIAINKLKLLFAFDTLSTVLLTVFLLFFSKNSIETLAFIRVMTGAVITFIFLFLLNYIIKFNLTKLLGLTLPACFASGLALLASTYIETVTQNISYKFLTLSLIAMTFFTSYVLTLLLVVKLLLKRLEEPKHLFNIAIAQIHLIWLRT